MSSPAAGILVVCATQWPNGNERGGFAAQYRRLPGRDPPGNLVQHQQQQAWQTGDIGRGRMTAGSTLTPDIQPLWTPSADRIAGARVTQFMQEVERAYGVALPDMAALHRWSVDNAPAFWAKVWEFCGVRAATRGERILVDAHKMPGARWFPDAQLNFAENLLRKHDDTPAMIFWGEDKVRLQVSWAELHAQVSQCQQALKAAGVGPGTRVAGFMPNMPQTIIATLATASLGAIWSSASPDFGVQGLVDRFGQIAPVVLFTVDGYHYNGKTHGVLDKVRAATAQIPSITTTVVVPYATAEPDIAGLPGAVTYGDFLGAYPATDVAYTMMPFEAPLYILFSSGTTGVPKCIVHSAGGTLLQHLKEHQLHSDLRDGERFFYYTTCGWMMWNWLVSGLASGATLVLYDGSPFYPTGNVLWDLVDAVDVDFFGTSAKYIDALIKAGLRPRDTHRLSNLRIITSTASPLSPEGFAYVYDAIKPDLQLSSISGGTDIVSCFALGSPISPVYVGELQCRGLGMDVQCFDDAQHSVIGEKGELVCLQPFPCMPVSFWNDPGDEKYRKAYFERFPDTWVHGDYIEITPRGGMIIYGRSDTTLNPGGVRIGTAEIYRQVEQLDAVVESLVIGQDWDNDVRVVLFVVLRAGLTLSDDLVKAIKTRIREGCTPRHVPAKIIQVSDIPRTKSNKIVELAVRDVVHGRPVKNKEALANPQALDLYKDLPELQT
jgi:acetoacetyl-CoA synthetase